MSVAAAISGLLLTSFDSSPPTLLRPRALTPLEATPAVDVVSSADRRAVASAVDAFVFTIVAVNTGERVTVRCPPPAFDPDATSLVAARRLMRALEPDREGDIDPRLVALLRDVARATGGTIELVSAYRRPAWPGDHNYHVRGRAADIRIPGLSARQLRDVAGALGIKGIGYYPTSKMVHVDVRDVAFGWTDWSGPERAP